MRKLIMIAIESDQEFGASEISISFPEQMQGAVVRGSIEMMDLDAVNQSDVLSTARSVKLGLSVAPANCYGDAMVGIGRRALGEAAIEIAAGEL